MVKKPIVVWSIAAEASLKREYEHIKVDSLVNAEKVKDEIFAETKRLAEYPEKYPPDKFKNNNPGNYRAFEKCSLRVAYRHTEDEIRILRVRHIKQEPKSY